MTKSMQADLFFQICIQDFADDFGIQDPARLEAQRREIVPESVEIDTVVSFPDDFDFTTLQDRIFPFWGKMNVIEYKGMNDPLAPMHICKYALMESGIMTTYLLSKKRKDRSERRPLSQKASKEQLAPLVEQGAKHFCSNTILSTTDPVGIRKGCRLEPVDAYEHLRGALYHRTVWEDDFAGNIAVYLVVLNDLPMHPKNAPLLLLSTGNKQIEFCEWLLETHEEMSLQEKQLYILYLTGYNLVKDEEVINKMWKKVQEEKNHNRFLIELMSEGRDRGEFFREISSVLFKTDSPIEAAQQMLEVDSPMEMAQAALQVDSPLGAAQKMLQADSPMEMAQAALQVESPLGAAQKMLQVDSPIEMAQAALQVDSPMEMGLKLFQTEEQVEQLLELIRKQNLEKAKTE